MSPYLDGRVDLARYQTGCIEDINQIPCDWGGSVSRPGLIYDERVDRVTVMHEFVVNQAISYVLLFSEYELRILKDGEIVQEASGGDLVITTPYEEDDLYELKVDTLVDIGWISHPDYFPRQLTRESELSWTLETLPIYDPPTLERSSDNEDITITPSAKTGTITLTASEGIFTADHVGSYWRIGTKTGEFKTSVFLGGDSNTVTSDWLLVQGEWSFATTGNWETDVLRIERRYPGKSVETIRDFDGSGKLRNVSDAGTQEDPAELRIYAETNADNDDGYDPNAVIEIDNDVVWGVVKITGFTSATEVTAEVVEEPENRQLWSTSATDEWEEASWSDERGHPATVAVHERRLFLASTTTQPNRFWASGQDDRQDFVLGDDATDAFSYDLPSRDIVQWLLSDRNLLVGSRKEEIMMSSGRDDLALTPENSIARKYGSYGSSRVQAIQHANSVLYVDRNGRKVRELSDDSQTGAFRNANLSAFAPDLFTSYVLQMKSARVMDQQIVFFVLADRTCIALVHDRDQQMSSWFKIETDGDFESVGVQPGDQDEDRVYFMVRRTINSVVHRQVESLSTNEWTKVLENDQSNMVYVDMAKVIDNAGYEISEITGLDDWEGKEVAILADGAILPSKTVTSGTISVSTAADKIIVGLPYERNTTPMWFEDTQSPTQGKLRKIAKVLFSVYQSGNVTVKATDEETFGALSTGQELQSYEIARRDVSDNLGGAPALETGYFEVSLESRHSRQQSVEFTTSQPLPMILQTMHLTYEINDR